MYVYEFSEFSSGGDAFVFFSGKTGGKAYMCFGNGRCMAYTRKKGWPKQFVLNCGRDELRKQVFDEMTDLAKADEVTLQEEIWEALLIHTKRRKL